MKTALVTGAAGLVGSQAATRLAAEGFRVIGIDNDARRRFFGPEASTAWRRNELQATVPGYEHYSVDIRDRARIRNIFRRHGGDIAVVIHAAAQPAHDWAARAPAIDFSINAGGTLVLLEAARRWSPGASFIFLSSNKVYGDHPNRLPLIEGERRWEVDSTIRAPRMESTRRCRSIRRRIRCSGRQSSPPMFLCRNTGSTTA